jgi:hypothetical protein
MIKVDFFFNDLLSFNLKENIGIALMEFRGAGVRLSRAVTSENLHESDPKVILTLLWQIARFVFASAGESCKHFNSLPKFVLTPIQINISGERSYSG